MLTRTMIYIMNKIKVEGGNIDIVFHNQPVDINGLLHECMIISPYLNSMNQITAFALTKDWKTYKAQYDEKSEEWTALRKIKKGKKNKK